MRLLASVVFSGVLIVSLDASNAINQFPICDQLGDNSSHLHIQLNRAIEKVDLHDTIEFDEKIPEKPIVILVPSYNNSQWYKENLNSIFMQNYTNYRVVYIDDVSPDGTGALVEKYVHSQGQADRFTFIKNKERKLAMANIYNAIVNYCNDEELVVMVDGDDFLAQPNALKYINHVYSTQTIWLTYGSNLFLSQCERVGWQAPFPQSVIEKNGFRKFRHGLTHMRTFYAWLFKKINKQDLMYRNVFVSMTYDVAMFLPMIEMAGSRHLFIDKILYLYNDLNELGDYRVNGKLQWHLNLYLRSKQQYQPLK